MKKSVFLLSLSAIFLVFVNVPFFASAQTLSPADKARLERELVQVEAEQKAAEKELSNAQAQSSSLARDISVLTAKIKVAQLNIKAKNLLIENLGKDIKGKETHIAGLEDRIDRGKDSLAVIMRKTNEVGSYTLPEIMLSQSSLTGVLNDIDSFASVQEGLKETFEQLRSDKSETETEKGALEKRRNAESDARYAIQMEEKNIKADEAEKQRLLSISKGNEKSYSALLAEKRTRASQIRAELFQLRDAAAIPFEQALAYAQNASRQTGVRPAIILAILTQESNLGANVGSCYLTDPTTGAGAGANTGTPIAKVMSPTRDVPPFLDIMSKLGGDPYKQRVSCPQSVGWGGAMGPAQFIASTWVLLVDRLQQTLGISAEPNPWNPAHAIMSLALYMEDLGAGAGTYSAERNAACRYYSGRSCSASSLIASYGNSVIAKADAIQRTKIDALAGL